jgi:hypothetical protein
MGGWCRQEGLRGAVGGWFPTVPRAELKALIEHAKHSPSALYGGDCKHVIEAAQRGVPKRWTTSRNMNADLWRDLRRLMIDEGTNITAVKIAAHATYSSAADEGEGALELWHGNDEADAYAKELCKELVGKDPRAQEVMAARELSRTVLARIAVAAAWNFKSKADLLEGRIKRTVKHSPAQNAGGDHDIVVRARGGWECRRCLKCGLSNIGLRRLRRSSGAGDVEGQIHATHILRETRGVKWCIRCGCYSSRWPRELRRACKQSPQSEAQHNVRRRLSAGLPPTTAQYLEDVATERRSDGASRSAARAASVPSGRYLRLPGGPLHRAAATVEQKDDVYDCRGAEDCGRSLRDAHDALDDVGDGGENGLPYVRVPASEAVSGATTRSEVSAAGGGGDGPRRRLRGKQRIGSHSAPEVNGGEAIAICRPSPGDSWSRRLACRPCGGNALCQRCDSFTRARCRGCEKPICATCAKSRLACV